VLLALAEVAYSDKDRRNDKPVDDRSYKIFQRLLEYDRSDLNSTVEGVEASAYWRLENVSFEAAYNGERVSAHLYLPKNAAPPYQVVVFMGGIENLNRRTAYDEAIASVTSASCFVLDAPYWFLRTKERWSDRPCRVRRETTSGAK
jgi:hypothetical protein